MTAKKRVAKVLRKLREDKGFSQTYVARELGLSNSQLSNYENGHRAPDLETLVQFALFYQVSVDFILNHDDTRYILLAKTDAPLLEKLKALLSGDVKELESLLIRIA